MLFNIREKSLIYLLLLSSSAIVIGGIGFYIVDLRVDEPSIKNLEDALWLTIATITTVGYGEIYPHTTEGRIVASILLFAGILTFFGFISTIASKIINPTSEVKIKQDKEKKEEDKKNVKAVIDYHKAMETYPNMIYKIMIQKNG